jgi:hypothetical protein|tara:strand:- start:57 stop:320 length:264 start_codon:yes stop_codon:yes gene_type:complete
MAFKMKGFMKENPKDNGERTIGGESLSELVEQGRVVNKPSKVEGGVDYKYKIVGKTPSGKSKIKILGEYDITGKTSVPGTKGEIKFD